MKKFLLTLMMSLAVVGVVFAQAQYESHWSSFNPDYNPFASSDAITTFVQLYGEFVESTDNWADLEIAAFVGDDCRGHAFLEDWTDYDDPHPGAELYVFYDNENEAVTFKMYDHSTGALYDGLAVGTHAGYVTGTDHWEIYNGLYEQAFIIGFFSTFTKHIDGYNGGTGGYYLIASPITAEVTPSADNGFITGEDDQYDLYYFDQESSDEWINYNDQTDGGFQIESGKGYLYASNESTDLVFMGAPYNGDGTVALDYVSGNEFTGWNLIGNPFSDTAFIDSPFYRMNDEGTELDPGSAGGKVEPMEGVFVKATEDGQSVTFTLGETEAIPTLALNLSRDSKVVDRAVVSFGQERSLPKFQLNPNHTKVYIPQESRDYAVVTAGEMGEMPVGFKAEKNGSYTLDFTAQAVSFAYLHLIDNKTGKDVDLLESPAYSFDALTTDYASRFKLVFATGNATDDNFAFNSNGLWIISNEGEATLQVVDVTGRILSSETVSGCVSKAISAAPGVYMLRLINGDNMKVQKVVVK